MNNIFRLQIRENLRKKIRIKNVVQELREYAENQQTIFHCVQSSIIGSLTYLL